VEAGEPQVPAAGIRVLIVDDQAVFRLGLRQHLNANGIEVVGEAEDGRDVVALAVETSPDVVLMNTSIHGVSSVETTRSLRAAVPAAHVLMVTDSTDDEVLKALMAGACGCLVKDEDGDQILAAIAAAAAGESPLSPRIASGLIRRVREREPELVGANAAMLTTRERQVLGLIVEGRENNEIAEELVISPETVKTHVSAILEKLHVDNRVQAAVAAVSIGLVRLLG
jgi:DNA-binding NarL/FixJ family response regulator